MTPTELAATSFLGLILALASGSASASSPTSPVAEFVGERARDLPTPVVLRFVKQSVVGCGESKRRIHRQRFNCAARKQLTAGAATLRFEPLPDPQRQIMGTDRRESFTVTLTQVSNRPIELHQTILRGPWRVTWKEASRAILAEIESVPMSIVASQTLGSCQEISWGCRLESKRLENQFEVRLAQR